MNIEKAADMLEKELGKEGITGEEIIKLYGSLEDWANQVVHIIKGTTK